MTALRRVGLAATLLLAIGCSDDPVSASLRGPADQNISVPVGAEINVILGPAGPGYYESPPDVSSEAVRFIDMAHVGPPTPGGVTQRFRFRAMRRGHAQIIFHPAADRGVQGRVVIHSVDVI